MALAGKKARVRASGDSVSFTDESFSTTDDQNYTIDDEDKLIWDRTAEITVYEDGVETTEDYEINRLTGTITFDTVNATRGDITADGDYLPLQTVAEAYEYNYTLEGANSDSTSFGSDFINREQTLLDISGDISRWYELDDYFTDILLSGDPFIVEFYSFYEENNGGVEPDIRAWIILNSDEISAVVDGLIEESVSFEGTNDIDDNTVAKI